MLLAAETAAAVAVAAAMATVAMAATTTHVISHDIGGNCIPDKMARLAESQSPESATTVCCHLVSWPLKTNDGSDIQVRQRHVLYGIPT